MSKPGSVIAGSAILATQYNELLDFTWDGHNHAGGTAGRHTKLVDSIPAMLPQAGTAGTCVRGTTAFGPWFELMAPYDFIEIQTSMYPGATVWGLIRASNSQADDGGTIGLWENNVANTIVGTTHFAGEANFTGIRLVGGYPTSSGTALSFSFRAQWASASLVSIYGPPRIIIIRG